LKPDHVLPDQFHFSYRRQVEFADTDLAGIMHFSNFFRFVECAEHAFFRSLGFQAYTVAGSDHQGWPRLAVACEYLKPARFQDLLEVSLRIEEIRTSSLTYGFWVFGPAEAGRALLATGSFSIIHVQVDPQARELRKTPIPAGLRAQLESAVATNRIS
jgi:YbgC/YbaW family acyl-CoA thioester hydrolase